MTTNAEWLRDTCQDLIRELTRLSQLNRPLGIEDFYKLSEGEVLLKTLFSLYRSYIIGLSRLDVESDTCDPELTQYMENALARHTNVISPETYGVVDNAYLLAINVIMAISREADEM